MEQQALQGLHRIRSLWMGTRTSRINALRGFFREFGIAIPVGARTGIEAISRVLADSHTAIPNLIRGTAKLLVEEIRLLEDGSEYAAHFGRYRCTGWRGAAGGRPGRDRFVCGPGRA